MIMMKLGERLIILAVCSLLATLLLMMLYNEMAYLKALQLKMQFRDEFQSKLEPFIGKLTTSIDKLMYHPKNVLKAETKAMFTERKEENNNTDVKYDPQKNLFSDLHKYSLHNPHFRLHMEWPPLVTVSPHNPNIAEIWDVPIEKNTPNWLKFHLQISKQYLYDDTEVIDDLLHDMATEKIIAVENHPGGTQFKLIIHFENGGKALFKPMRSPKYEELFPNYLYYTEFEKHYSEIASFHLDRILGFRRAPPVVGRKINVTGELYRLADYEFLETFFISPAGNHCFYGKCRLFCDVHHAFCGDPHMLEGSFAAYLPTAPRELLDQRLIRSPWRRTYEHWKQAEWEKNHEYCSEYVIKTPPFRDGTRRIYDAMDCAIFDFLIGNMDRHHYDEFTVFGNDSTPTIIHMDNGRGFGKSYHDEMSILLPLMQCCVVRLSTFNTLYNFHVGPKHLSDLMRESLVKDPLSPVLTEDHLQALDRRVDRVLDVIRKCIRVNIPAVVFLDDIV